jgi:hypothetical protein
VTYGIPAVKISDDRVGVLVPVEHDGRLGWTMRLFEPEEVRLEISSDDIQVLGSASGHASAPGSIP